VPRRRPPGTMALTSPGTVFLLHAMCAGSKGLMHSARHVTGCHSRHGTDG
jgi:hypothetical protein